MIEFETNGKNGNYAFNLPTSLNEITKDYLEEVTKDVMVADNYTLVGVCYREKLSNLVLSVKQRKNNITTAVVPIFVKKGVSDPGFYNGIEIGNKLILAASDIAIGHHVVAPKNLLTIENFLNFIEGDTDVYHKALGKNEYCYFIEFKLVPNCNIHGYYKTNNNIDYVNPFVKKVN